jgi:hypothetical protein
MDTITPTGNALLRVYQSYGSWQKMADDIAQRKGGYIISHMGLRKIGVGLAKPRLMTLQALASAGEPFESMAKELMAEHYPEQKPEGQTA